MNENIFLKVLYPSINPKFSLETSRNKQSVLPHDHRDEGRREREVRLTGGSRSTGGQRGDEHDFKTLSMIIFFCYCLK